MASHCQREVNVPTGGNDSGDEAKDIALRDTTLELLKKTSVSRGNHKIYCYMEVYVEMEQHSVKQAGY